MSERQRVSYYMHRHYMSEGQTASSLPQMNSVEDVEALEAELGIRMPFFPGMKPATLEERMEAIATRILVDDRKENHGLTHGATDGWLSTHQMAERAMKEALVSDHLPGFTEDEHAENFLEKQESIFVTHQMPKSKSREWDTKKRWEWRQCLEEGCEDGSMIGERCIPHQRKYARKIRGFNKKGNLRTVCMVDDCPYAKVDDSFCQTHTNKQTTSGESEAA